MMPADLIMLYDPDETLCSDPIPERHREIIGCGGPPTFAIGWYARPLIVCPDDKLAVCVHEIAHAIFAALRFTSYWDGDHGEPAVKRRFSASEVRNLWTGYALENEDEFFAEMSAIYFCVGSVATTRPKLHCADELKRHDPFTYEVIHGVYRGSADLR